MDKVVRWGEMTDDIARAIQLYTETESWRFSSSWGPPFYDSTPNRRVTSDDEPPSRMAFFRGGVTSSPLDLSHLSWPYCHVPEGRYNNIRYNI